ncbi:MAG: glycosyltransferase family 39 protein [Nautiliaceae bacterium]
MESFPFIKYILDFSVYIFGHNDVAVRLPGVLVSAFSLYFFYKIALFYLKRKDALLATYLYFLIPGVIVSSLIINKAIYLIFLTLLFIYLYHTLRKISYLVLILLAFIDYSFIPLFFSLIFFAVYKRDNILVFLSLILLAFNFFYFHYDIGGKPKGHFIDLIGIYFLIFSPFVFVYFLYSLYKCLFFKKKNLIFFISAFSFLFSLILSFRQKIKVDDYAPFMVIFMVCMVKVFLNSYRVRLPNFRIIHKILFIVLLISLISFDVGVFFNFSTPARKLTSSYYFIKPLVEILKSNKIDYVYSDNDAFMKALNFYGIKKGGKYFIEYNKKNSQVFIIYNKKVILKINVSKLNTL